MKLALIIDQFPRLSETFVLNQITGLMDLGHSVDIYVRELGDTGHVHQDVTKYQLMERVWCFNPVGSVFSRTVKGISLFFQFLFKCPLKALKSLNVLRYKNDAFSFRLLHLVSHFEGKEYDVVYCHFGPNGNLGVALKEMNCIKRVVTVFHGYDLSLFLDENGTQAYDRLFKKGDLFLPISRYWKDKLVKLGCPEARIRVHHMGIDVEKFARKSFEQPVKSINIVSIGRMVEKKGLEFAIRAVGEVARKHGNVKYRIIGGGSLKNKLQELITSLSMQADITLMGSLNGDEVRKILQEAHLFLLPSVTAVDGDKEGIPVVLMEAMATGLPVVSTFHSGIPELVIDGESGYLVPERDVTALVDRLENLMTKPELFEPMGRKGRAMVEKYFNIDLLNKELEQILSFNDEKTR